MGYYAMYTHILEIELFINVMNQNIYKLKKMVLETRQVKGGGGEPKYPTSRPLRSATGYGTDLGIHQTMSIPGGNTRIPHRETEEEPSGIWQKKGGGRRL